MARGRVYPSNPSSPDEGYPVSHRVDGVDTKKIANHPGNARNLGRNLNQHTEWTNSKTGKRTEAPGYATDDE